ncbi:P27 family phage terminase small subunit, partial [Arthrobacter sp. H41]|uniref:P27 family phage terminase small subunit n=1 Tax=Arthrobacter sp. H41 TaxID=1312978 RepID=UPI00138ADE05
GEPDRFAEADRAGLIAYCTFWADFCAAAVDVAERGVTVEGRSSADRARVVRNPSLAAAREASQQLRLWAVQLCLTPAARRGEERTPAADSDNPFA